MALGAPRFGSAHGEPAGDAGVEADRVVDRRVGFDEHFVERPELAEVSS